MLPLSRLLADLPEARVIGDPDRRVRDVRLDSRQVTRGDVFVAIPGRRLDGARFARQAVEQGAAAVVAERADLDVPDGTPIVVVPCARKALAALAARRWDKPTHKLGLVGVTGTDGKTTTTILTAAMLEAAGHRAGLITTVEHRVPGRRLPEISARTTPEAPDLQRALARMLKAGADWGVIEVSSHGLSQHRVAECAFDVAVLTNVTPEHLDFHGTFEEYRAAKALLFQQLGGDNPKPLRRFGVVNNDDASADFFKAAAPVDVLTYAVHRSADVRARDVALRMDGTSFVMETPIGSRAIETRLVGHFNVYNWLAAATVAIGQGLGWDAIERAAATSKPIRGRVQQIKAGQPFTVLVDFAHTPQALAATLESCRALTRRRVIVVFGHPGERYDRNRPRLGVTAVRGADLAIVTADDAYGEDPDQVIDQIVEGARAAGGCEGQNLLVIRDRREAIATALAHACPGDLVLIAGRGHLQYMENAEERIPFDDARVAREVLGQRYRSTV